MGLKLTAEDADGIIKERKEEPMYVFTVAVEFATHDEVKNGCVDAGLQFAAVLAESESEATLVAAQMVAAVGGVMPTRCVVINVMEV